MNFTKILGRFFGSFEAEVKTTLSPLVEATKVVYAGVQ
jgi:hypothetical protein